MSKPIPRRAVTDLPPAWYPFSARPVLPELEPNVLSDLGDSWRTRLPEVLTVEAIDDPFALRTWPERLLEMRRWPSPRIVLLAGGADPFERSIDASYLRDIFKTMVLSHSHSFVVLTRRVDRAVMFLRVSRARGLPEVLPENITIGTPDGATADEIARVELLRRLPIRSRFAIASSKVESSAEQGSLFGA